MKAARQFDSEITGEVAALNGRWRKITDDTVVTTHADGSPASVFGDDSWNVNAYGSASRIQNIHFGSIGRIALATEKSLVSKIQAKQVQFLLMHEATDEVPAPPTLKAQVMYIRDFSKFISPKNLTLYEAFEQPKVVIEYISRPNHETKSQKLHAILSSLHRLGKATTGVDIDMRALHAPMMLRFKGRPEHRQHAAIPTQIYSTLLYSLETEIKLLEDASKEITNALLGIYEGRDVELTANLEAVLTHFNRQLDKKSFSALLNDIATLCETTAISFSGMRANEAAALPYKCLTTITHDGVDYYAIEGRTTKLSGGRIKRAFWITNKLGARAIALAQEIFGVIHARFGSKSYRSSVDGSHLLFCRTGLLQGKYAAGRGIGGKQDYFEQLRLRIAPTITSDDVEELKVVDPFRAWDSEPEFCVGELWPLTRHQLRRSLALYAQSSGIVSLPSLKRQLHQITRAMALYYAKGSAFAKNVLASSKDHFAREWANTTGLSQYLAYAAQVVFSDERLFGGHAEWTRTDAVKMSPISIFSRAETERRFKLGQSAYKSTPLGGCTTTTECRSSPINWLPIECLEGNCKDLVVSPAKLRRAIVSQERRVTHLELAKPGSVEFRIEQNTLAVLQDFEARELRKETINAKCR